MTQPKVERSDVIHALEEVLRPLAQVDAFWEGGAAAWDTLDALSDMDLYVVMEDGAAEEAFEAIENAIGTLSKIEHAYTVAWPPSSGVFQKFYKLHEASPFLLVDLALLERSAPEKFLQPEIHGHAVVFFDKTGVTEVAPMDEADFDRQLGERLAQLETRTAMFHIFVEKEIRRENWIEALDAYRAYVVAPLMEVLRMKHLPLHHNFRSQYIQRELPADVVKRLERLLFVAGPEGLHESYERALDWFHDVAAELGNRCGA